MSTAFQGLSHRQKTHCPHLTEALGVFHPSCMRSPRYWSTCRWHQHDYASGVVGNGPPERIFLRCCIRRTCALSSSVQTGHPNQAGGNWGILRHNSRMCHEMTRNLFGKTETSRRGMLLESLVERHTTTSAAGGGESFGAARPRSCS